MANMKIDQLKASIKYQSSHVQRGTRMTKGVCKDCKHFTSEIKPPAFMMKGGYSLLQMVSTATEQKMRCTLHGFAVKKTAVCKSFEAKP